MFKSKNEIEWARIEILEYITQDKNNIISLYFVSVIYVYVYWDIKCFFQLMFRSFLTFPKLIICRCSVAKSCLTLCDPMNCSTPGFPVLHYLQESAQTHVHWVGDTIQPSHPLSPPFPALNLSQLILGSFSVSQLFASGGQSTRASASPSVLPVNSQGWFPSGLTGLMILLSKRL